MFADSISQAFPVPLDSAANLIIRKHLKNALSHVPSTPGSGHLPSDIGLFLSQSIHVLDLLADSLVDGQHMATNTREVLRELVKENDLSELDSLDSLMGTHSVLRKISKRLHDTAKEVRLLWDEAPGPPCMETVHVPAFPSRHDAFADLQLSGGSITQNEPYSNQPVATSLHATMPPPSELQQPTNRTSISSIDSQPRNIIGDLNRRIESLKGRGKGSHTCPLGKSCRKGGVQSNGELVVFARNSEFRAHVQKHAKPFKCELPGCPTRRGFARLDQLRRHQSTVSHSEAN